MARGGPPLTKPFDINSIRGHALPARGRHRFGGRAGSTITVPGSDTSGNSHSSLFVVRQRGKLRDALLNSRDPLLLIRLGEEHVEYFKPLGLPLPSVAHRATTEDCCSVPLILCENSHFGP